MLTTRRNALTLLGLAGVASPALASDDYRPDKGVHHGNETNLEKIAAAFDRLAKAIRAGEVSVNGMAINTKIEPDEMVEQVLTFRFYLPDPPVT